MKAFFSQENEKKRIVIIEELRSASSSLRMYLRIETFFNLTKGIKNEKGMLVMSNYKNITRESYSDASVERRKRFQF